MRKGKNHRHPARPAIFKGLASLLLLAMSLATANADAARSVRDLMAPGDFDASGLEKLSDDELNHLSQWIERYRAGAVDGPPVPPKRPSQMTESELDEYQQEKQEERDFKLVAKVIPAFRGWSGKTVFHLDNGQVWQQRQVGKMRYNGDDSTIIVTRNLMGRYVLTHLDSDRSVGVKRIR